jgi:hypothetical protein
MPESGHASSNAWLCGATRRAEEALDLGAGSVGAYPGQVQDLTGQAHSLNDETEDEMFRTDV